MPDRARTAADVGAGDGQLARHLAGRGLRMVASERSAGSFARLRAASPDLDCRLGEGLAVLEPGEVEGAVLAGMGGRKILRILGAAPKVVGRLDWLVLQPQQQAGELVDGLAAAGFRLERDTQAVQGGRSYRVLLVRPPS